jgi:hypothetical protein
MPIFACLRQPLTTTFLASFNERPVSQKYTLFLDARTPFFGHAFFSGEEKSRHGFFSFTWAFRKAKAVTFF